MSLPDNVLKEHLSRSFLRLAAAQSGFIVYGTDSDFGVDLQVKQVSVVDNGHQVRIRETGFAVDVQLKATCEKQVRSIDGKLAYDLDVQNYNDIVARTREDSPVPLVLVLFVLPDDPDQWLSLDPNDVTLRRCGFLWRPSPDDSRSENSSSVVIYVTEEDRIDGLTLDRLFQEYTS